MTAREAILERAIRNYLAEEFPNGTDHPADWAAANLERALLTPPDASPTPAAPREEDPREHISEIVEEAMVEFAHDRYGGTGIPGEKAADRILALLAAAPVREERTASLDREAVVEAARPFIAALEDQERRWELAKEPDEEGGLPDYLALSPAPISLTPTVAHARALRRSLAPDAASPTPSAPVEGEEGSRDA